MRTISFVDLAVQQGTLSDELQEAVNRQIARTDWILGDEVARFEEEFAAFCGVAYAVGTDNGMSALELAFRASGIGPGCEVITAANTFAATVYAIRNTGAIPVLVDVDPVTYTIDPGLIEAAVTDRSRAVVPVHLYGQPADMGAIQAVSERHGLVVIEDACQAHGARYRGRRAGSLGTAAAFSFYPAKNLGGWGDGGMLVTDDPEIAQTARIMRNYGQTEKYNHVLDGFNSRLDTLQAAVLRVKLRYLDRWNAARCEAAQRYSRLLEGAKVVTPAVAADRDSVWHLYVVRTAARDSLQAFLRDRGVETGIHYPVPIHLQPAFRDLGYGTDDFPISTRYAAEVLSLPMYPEISPSSVSEVAEGVASFDGAAPAGNGRLERLHGR